MELVRRWWWLALILVVAIGVWWQWRPGGGSQLAPSSRLQLEAHGGFAYIPYRQDHRLEIAYLRDINVPGCNVDQLGTELMVIDGNILEVQGGPVPADRKFNLAGAVVTFPDLETSNLPLTATRGNRPSGRPANTKNPVEWEDLKWVAGIGQDFPNSSLNLKWRELPIIDGRLVLKGGRVVALHPSDVVATDGIFDFKKGTITAFSHAVTDRLLYAVDVPNDRVVMQLTSAASGITRIVVGPRNPGQPVQLKLHGLHSSSTSTTLPVGAPITDYCSFYQLLQPVPPQTEWLIPHFAGTTTAPAAGVGLPSPGVYCPGMWGPEP
jgi:hypothetical protein